MEREKELEKVKKLIKENYEDARCGIYNSRNLVGDPMLGLFEGKYVTLDMCYMYSYFEVFGTTEKEFEELEKFYNGLRRRV